MHTRRPTLTSLRADQDDFLRRVGFWLVVLGVLFWWFV